MPSEERDRVREYARLIVDNVMYSDTQRLVARAVLRYVPESVPTAAPHPVASANDQTTRASIRDLGGVICEPIEEASSGVVEPSDDGEGTRRVGDLSLTRAIDISDDDNTRR